MESYWRKVEQHILPLAGWRRALVVELFHSTGVNVHGVWVSIHLLNEYSFYSINLSPVSVTQILPAVQ
jgi:hypothetical protein